MKLSVVIPVFNGENSIRELHQKLVSILSSIINEYEIIFVDDFSKDTSWNILKEIRINNPNVKIIRLTENFGQHRATFCGIHKTTGDFVITIDDDLESNPLDIPQLIEKQKQTGSDLIYADFVNDNSSVLRKVITSVYKFVSRTSGGKNKSRGSSFRSMTKQLCEKICMHKQEFIFIDEFCLWYANRIEFVSLKKLPTQRKKSNYSIFKLTLLSGELAMISSLFQLRLIILTGGTIAFFSFALGFYYLIKKFVYGVPVEGYTSLIVSILFSTGIILLSLGIIAEYIGKILRSQYGKPSYTIAEEL